MLKNYTNNLISLPGRLTYSNPVKNRELIKEYNIGSASGRKKIKYDRDKIEHAIKDVNHKDLTNISKYWYKTNPNYYRMIEYLVGILPFYWAIFPRVRTKKKNSAVLNGWYDALDYMEMINPEILGPRILRKVIIEGACYVAVKDDEKYGSKIYGVQFLPKEYCRSNKTYKNQPLVDFDVSYFDNLSPDDREQALQMYPSIITKKYEKWRKSKDKTLGSKWQTLDPNYSYAFSLRQDRLPMLLGVVLDQLDIQDAKDITMFKIEQEVAKIFIQKFNTNSQGERIYPLVEVQSYNRDVSDTLSDVPGLDVISTYADAQILDLQKSNAASTETPISQVAQNPYDTAGVSSKLFNADNAGTLAKSITVDENLIFPFLNEFKDFLQIRLDVTFNEKSEYLKTPFKIILPRVSTFNWQDLHGIYGKENALNSQMLAQIVSGRRQSDIMAAYYFEKVYFDFTEDADSGSSTSNTNSSSSTTDKSDDTATNGQVGRPELPDEQKSEKTLQNRESL